jgi:hypothetical protein
MDGHYFSGRHCPTDGYSSLASEAVADASSGISPEALSLDHLREAGVPESALAFAIVIEFGVEVASVSRVDLTERA